ncbi:sporulation protein YqfC [Desulfitibacter alkalitolerans]|uniref:sporulation protein YqfC n=1 Tax=Desulfitibacter alkalitolerans TaxID=264641 RepID=UPI001FA6E7F6|nr:sporulation protein YqfC [Desulfitibacter alkalitolerans]
MGKKTSIKKTRNRVGETLADAFDLPKELIIDIPKITIIGNQEMAVESHKGIIQYTSERIRISIAGGELIIAGKKLLINSILPEEIVIYGEFYQISFE